MSEIAPLTSAQTHARKAAEELNKAHRKESSEEHKHAANDFSRAARNTNDSEALRILQLLEEQHQRLASILQREDTEFEEATGDTKVSEQTSDRKDVQPVAPAKAKSPETATSAKTKSPSVKTASRMHSQTRESSASLARDIASRRGIPPSGKGQSSAAAQARPRQLSPESKRTRRSDRTGVPPKIPPSVVASQADLKEAHRSKKTEEDEGFSKFYNSLTTGTMSKLSSALAYAGLPLTADDINSDRSSHRRTVRASNEPDVKKYISKAALDAVEQQHRQRGTFGHGFGPGESFYVVQTGGGTYSYADIAKNRPAHLSGIDEDDEDSFVDAREIPGPSSPRRSRVAPQKRHTFGKGQSQEELEIQNATLHDTVNFLSSKLSHFEHHAQDEAMASMHQSTMTSRPSPEGGDPATQERFRQLEQQIEKQAEERQQLEDRAAKQAKMLEKYHSKWKEIKTSAKEKDKAKKEKAEKGGTGDNDPAVGVPDIS